MSKTPSSLVWDRVRKLQGKFVPPPLPVHWEGDLFVSKPVDVTELLGHHFASISNSDHYSSEFQEIRVSTRVVPPYSTNSESYNLPFSMEEMESAIHNSSPTSPGEDEI